MESLKSDDFSSLLAALGRSNNASLQNQAVVNQTMPILQQPPQNLNHFMQTAVAQPPNQWPQYYQQPMFQGNPNQFSQLGQQFPQIGGQSQVLQQSQVVQQPQIGQTQIGQPQLLMQQQPMPFVNSQAHMTTSSVGGSIPNTPTSNSVNAAATTKAVTSSSAVAASSSSNKYYIWIIIFLCVAVICFAFIAWMRGAKMKESYKSENEEEEEEELLEEEEEEVSEDTREIPPPSYLKYNQEDNIKEENVISENILNYAKGNYVDLSGFDLPFEERFPKFTPSKKIVADESQEVLDYAKKREALFEE
jgi:hypothetical protein